MQKIIMNIFGTITFEFRENMPDILIANFGHKLNAYERFIILQEIIKEFCIHISFISALAGFDVFFPFDIEYLIFRDEFNLDDVKNYKTIIKQLFDYDFIFFDSNTKKRKIISRVKQSIDIINIKRSKGIKYFEIEKIDDLGLLGRSAYINLFSKYIKRYSKEDCTITFNNKCSKYFLR